MGDALLQKTFTEHVLTDKKNNVGQVPKYYVENSHPAIIDKHTWDQVQVELAKRSSKPAHTGKLTKNNYKGKFSLSSLLICGKCGTPYRRCTWSRDGKKKIMWRCISRMQYGTKYCKTSPSLEEGALHNAILGVIIKKVQSNTTALGVLKQHIGEGLAVNDAGENDPYAVQARIGELNAALDDLYELQADNPNEDYENQFDALYDEKNALSDKLAQIKAAADHVSAEQSTLGMIFATVDELSGCPLDWDDDMIWQMAECIKVINKETLGIRFRWGEEMEVGIG